MDILKSEDSERNRCTKSNRLCNGMYEKGLSMCDVVVSTRQSSARVVDDPERISVYVSARAL